MYCPNCGTENKEDAAFCFKCGSELREVANVFTQNHNKLGHNEINQIGQLALELKQLDNVEKVLLKKQSDLASVNKSFDRKNKNMSNSMNWILMMSGISLGIVVFLNSLDLNLIICIIVAVVVDIIVYPKIKRSEEKSLKNLEERQTKVKAECEQIDNDKQQLIKAVSNKIGIIPPNYRYQMAVQFIYDSLTNMRARDLTEAINLYEEQLHRWKIEAAHQQMVDLARQQVTASQISATANVAIAANTREIANHIREDY